MSIVESFKKTIIFFDELEGKVITDYALIGGLAVLTSSAPHHQVQLLSFRKK